MKVKFSKGAIPADALANLFGGVLRDGRGAEIPIGGICTDSREADRDTVFCALRGAQTDGHEYIETALAAGCRCVLCEQSNEALEASGASAIVVKDTELALAKFANAYRQELSCKSVAVTGSVGKTTAKDMIASVLETSFSTYKTEGNHNSVIGMPLSLSEIPTDAQWSVLEMGMSGFGEIERLSIVAEPDVAVITNIGTAHMEMLGSRENICRAKLEILCGLRDGGTLILNGDEPLLRNISGKSYKTLYVSLERENSDFFANNIRVENGYTLFDITWKHGKACDFRINVMGRHNVYAALFAFAVGVLSGMDTDGIRLGLSRFSSTGLRQHIESLGAWTVIADCYNASPESMIASLEVLRELSCKTDGRSVAVLGDMLELGTQSCAMHQRVGAKVASLGIDLLVTLGARGRQIAVGAQRMGMKAVYSLDAPNGDNRRQIARRLRELLGEGDVVLFKASRGIGAEQIINELKV